MAFFAEDKSIDVYIDGSCINNGKKNSKAGYAVYFAEDNIRNEYDIIFGKQTNNTAELTAFIRCLEILNDDIEKNTIVNVYTDSEYVIKCASSFGAKSKAKNWKNDNGKTIPNMELVKMAHELYSKTKGNVKLHYIKAHTDLNDKHSIGNANADRLANLALANNYKELVDGPKIIELPNISFSTKDKAKSLGAKWDFKNKKWYIYSDHEENMKNQLINLNDNTEDKKYIKISFANKNIAKSLGARWDYSVKSWYYIINTISEENKIKLECLE